MKIRFFLAILFLCFGLFNIVLVDFLPPDWNLLIAFFFFIPILCQFSKKTALVVYSLWFGFFLVLQTILSPIVSSKSQYYTRAPNVRYKVDIQGNGIPGIKGIQNISTDEQGFRVIPKVDYASKKGKRIFAIGASTTEEEYLDDTKTWSHQLQEKLSEYISGNVELINTGLSGLRLVHHIATFDKIQKMDADVALILVGVNDWNRQIVDELGEIRKTGEPREDFLKFFSFRYSLLGLLIDRMKFRVEVFMKDEASIKDVEYLVEKGDYFTKQNNSLERPVKKEFFPDKVAGEYEKQLNILHQKCSKSNIKCIFITQPNGYQSGAPEDLKKRFWMTPPDQDQDYTLTLESLQHISKLYNNRLINFANSHGYNYCDLASAIPASLEYFYDDVHFTAKGSEAVAEFLFTCLKDKL